MQSPSNKDNYIQDDPRVFLDLYAMLPWPKTLQYGTARFLSFTLLLTIGKKSTGDLRLQQPP